MKEPSIEQMRDQIFFCGPGDAVDRLSAAEVRWYYRQQQDALRQTKEQAKDITKAPTDTEK